MFKRYLESYSQEELLVLVERIKELGNIVTTDIDGSLLYNDDYEENTLYNRQGLIPASIDVVLNTYKRTDGKKCLDQNDYSSCSIYRFSIKNISDISQELQMTLNPTANSFTNLKFMLLFSFGILIGTILISKMLVVLFKYFRSETYVSILGFMIGSTFIMFKQAFICNFSILEFIIGIILFVLGYKFTINITAFFEK